MMVETILESSQDFGMSNGALPQWKRELLQRRAARSRPSAPPAQPPPPPPPPPPATEEDEELRYGPGIVKRLKSRYLSLALRDAPRRRPSVLRRAASLEHLLDERPPPAPAPRHLAHSRPPRPVSLATPPAALAPPPALRRESVKRARSVDALSRLDSRDDPPPPSSPPPPLAPRPPPQPRAARPPRRPTPLLRDTERPPPDVVRSTLRKFESAPTRRAAPAARVSAVLRGLEGPQRTSTPEPRDGPETPARASPRSPSSSPPPPAERTPPTPIAPPSVDEPEGAGARPVSRAALEGIARAGSTVRYAFEAPRGGSHLPPVAAANPVLLGRSRQIGVIRPMPARVADDAMTRAIDDVAGKSPEPAPTARLSSPSPPPPPPTADVEPVTPGRTERKEPPPAAVVEPVPRTPPEPAVPAAPSAFADRDPSPELKVKPETKSDEIFAPLINGHTAPQRVAPEVRSVSVISKIGAAGIERAWSGSGRRKPAEAKQEKESPGGAAAAAPWARGADSPAPARRPRAPAPSTTTSVVFNFSNRKEVPDYIENDGIILRANRRNRIKAGEAGVVVLRPEALARGDSDSESEADGGPPSPPSPPSPCSVRFVNDNVLINGRSSMPGVPNRDRIAKLKLQFDDSLTRTFEYPSETSLCEDSPQGAAPAATGAAPAPAPAASPSPQLAESPLHQTLAANTHIASAALSSYTPSKTVSDVFQLGVTRHDARDTRDTRPEYPAESGADADADVDGDGDVDVDVDGDGDADGDGAGGASRSWSEARTHATDLLF